MNKFGEGLASRQEYFIICQFIDVIGVRVELIGERSKEIEIVTRNGKLRRFS